jgi:hypothetical protein
MIDIIDEKLSLSTLDEDISPVVDEPTITSSETLFEVNAAGLLSEVHAAGSVNEVNAAGSLRDANAAENCINEIVEVTIPDDTGGMSLLGSSSQSGAVRNYEIYNRMDGCSSDEETQTDNDDGNSIEDGTEILPEHHYVVLNDEMFEFGEFTSADISNDLSSNGCAESKDSVPHVQEYKNNDLLGANSVEVLDSVSSEGGSAAAAAVAVAAAVCPPPAVEAPYVSIPPLSAGNNVTNTSYRL